MPTLDAIQVNDTVIKQDGSEFSLWYNDTRYMCENIDTMESIIDKLFIINDDANLYEGKCDTLLIDHFEDYEDNKLPIVANCCKNIQHKQMLYWDIFSDYRRYADYQELRKQFNTLPNFTPSQFYKYVEMI
jgi:hypothetical protein